MQARKKLCQCQNWFARLRSGDFDLKDASRSGHTCVEKHLKQLGYVNKLDIWVPHKLNEIQLTKRISIYDSLLKRNKTDPFLKRIITGDEKWVCLP